MSLILSGTDGLSDVDGSAATPAIRGTDANTGIFFPAADTIGFAEGGAEVMRIDSSGNVGIGTASPSYRLDAQGTVASTNVARIKPLVGSNDATVILDIQAGNSSSLIKFTNNGGITFPATQSASSDANTLDDYEEGTWTPTDQSGAGLSLTVASSPSYTKIGRMVTVMARITYPSTANTSNQLLGGLPFTSSGSAGDPGGFLRYSSYGSGLMVEVLVGATTFRCWTLAPGNVTNANASLKRFDFVMTYFV
jgi:hypothetical protein